jgi:hypothetical protein
MIDMPNKLKDLEMPLPGPYVIHYILLSLPSIFENFMINYNGSDKKWTMDELIAKYSQEEERLRTENKDYVNLISQDLKRIFAMVSLAESLEESPLDSRRERGRSLIIKSLMITPRKKLLR